MHFVCINAGDYLGQGRKYVEILRDSIFRNLEEGKTAKFTVFTDDPEDYPDIHKRPLVSCDAKGWFHKLSLFKPGVFEDGERIIYIDLDVVIFGPLDEIVKYRGGFAILKDFNTLGFNSSFMMWEAGQHTDIWTEYERAWLPEIEGGDQIWIERILKNPDYLQVLYPDRFASYKQKCKYGVPRNTSVVVFHGEPRPHDVDGWVKNVWKIGGASSAEMITVGNTSEEKIIQNVKHALTLGLDEVRTQPANNLHAVLIAGGPSLKDNIEEICERYNQGQIIFSMNGSAQFLKENGIDAHYHVMLDARPENIQFSSSGVRLYSSQCDPEILKGKCLLWHTMEVSPIVPHEATFIGFGSTVGLKSIGLVYVLGYRNIHLYGYDSCYSNEDHHAYEQKLNDGERIMEVQVEDRMYKCAPWMAIQADEFTIYVPELLKTGVTLSVHGTGLIPFIARVMNG